MDRRPRAGPLGPASGRPKPPQTGPGRSARGSEALSVLSRKYCPASICSYLGAGREKEVVDNLVVRFGSGLLRKSLEFWVPGVLCRLEKTFEQLGLCQFLLFITVISFRFLLASSAARLLLASSAARLRRLRLQGRRRSAWVGPSSFDSLARLRYKFWREAVGPLWLD